MPAPAPPGPRGLPPLSAETAITEIRDGTGGQRIHFANTPVNKVLSLSIDGLEIPPFPDGGFGVGYVFSPTELALRGYVFTRRAQNVIIRYTVAVATPPLSADTLEHLRRLASNPCAVAQVEKAPLARLLDDRERLIAVLRDLVAARISDVDRYHDALRTAERVLIRVDP